MLTLKSPPPVTLPKEPADKKDEKKEEKIEENKDPIFFTPRRVFDHSVYYEIDRIAIEALDWITQIYLFYVHKHPAVVFDIDGTVFDNNFSNPQRGYPALKPVYQLYQAVLTLGIEVYFVTARGPELSSDTILNLKYAGYTKYTEIFFQPPKTDYVQYKTSCRKKITENGRTILFNIGDRYEDLEGGYALKNFKLPNQEGFENIQSPRQEVIFDALDQDSI